MRIWAFPSFYPYDVPGERWRGIFAHRQYKGLIENGADLRVVIPVSWKPVAPLDKLHPKWKNIPITFPEKRVHDGITVYHPRIDNLLPYAIDKRSHREKFHDAVVKLFRELNIKPDPETDIFYSQWLPESVNVQYTAHKMGIKSAIMAIGDDVVIWPHESKSALKEFEELITNADLRFNCADYLGVETNKIMGRALPYTVINMGVEYQHFKPVATQEKAALRDKYNLPQDKLLVLNVSSAIIRKGWLDLLDALCVIRKEVPDIGLVAVYSTDPEMNLPEEVAKRGLSDIFFGLGEVPPEQLNEVYNVADVFCLPSHWEGLACANIEAMSCGIPVLTTNVCGHPELVKDNETGLLIPPKNKELLQSKLLALLKDESLRERLSKTGRTFITDKWGSFADNAKLLYEKLITA